MKCNDTRPDLTSSTWLMSKLSTSSWFKTLRSMLRRYAIGWAPSEVYSQLTKRQLSKRPPQTPNQHIISCWSSLGTLNYTWTFMKCYNCWCVGRSFTVRFLAISVRKFPRCSIVTNMSLVFVYLTFTVRRVQASTWRRRGAMVILAGGRGVRSNVLNNSASELVELLVEMPSRFSEKMQRRIQSIKSQGNKYFSFSLNPFLSWWAHAMNNLSTTFSRLKTTAGYIRIGRFWSIRSHRARLPPSSAGRPLLLAAGSSSFAANSLP
jgi:hypothetical protein